MAGGSPRAPGRPRDPELDERVVATVRELLVEVGWHGTTIRKVAERSGVSRPAIARRWSSKAHLVLEALLGPAPDLARFHGADGPGWIDEVVAGSFELFDRPEMRSAVPGLLAALHDHRELRAEIWEGFTGPAASLVAGEGDDEGHRRARAAIAIAAGAALFTASMMGPDDPERSVVQAMLRSTLTGAIAPGDGAPPRAPTGRPPRPRSGADVQPSAS